MTHVNPLSIVGLFLTLISVLGTYFYLHLGQWLRDLLALERKQDINKYQGTESEERAILECRIEMRRLSSWPTYVVNLVIVAFVIFVVILGLSMIQSAASDPMFKYVESALYVFGGVFIALSTLLLVLGFTASRRLARTLQ